VFKLFIYAVFLYVIYRLITGGKKKKAGLSSSGQRAGAGASAAHDQLVEDPVCHIYIPKKQAIVLQEGDAPVFFCSEHCRNIYCDGRQTSRQENG
jgi:YHS domain-containing protein